MANRDKRYTEDTPSRETRRERRAACGVYVRRELRGSRQHDKTRKGWK